MHGTTALSFARGTILQHLSGPKPSGRSFTFGTAAGSIASERGAATVSAHVRKARERVGLIVDLQWRSWVTRYWRLTPPAMPPT